MPAPAMAPAPARRLKYFDAHCDTIYCAHDHGFDMLQNGMFVNFQNRLDFEAYGQFMAIWQKESVVGDEAFAYATKVWQYVCAQEQKHGDAFAICRTLADYEAALAARKLCGILTLEGAGSVGSDPDNVALLYERGFRVMTMTWSYENEAGYGCRCDPDLPLKPYGKELLRRMAACGMVCDVSHLNDAGFAEVAASGCKMMATHSNARSLVPDRRNITDAQFKTLVQKGTGTGINLYPTQIGGEGTVAEVADHIEHYLSLGGEDSVYFGADFDGYYPYENRIKGIDSLKDLYKIADELTRRNLSATQVDKIFFSNLDRIVRTFVLE